LIGFKDFHLKAKAGKTRSNALKTTVSTLPAREIREKKKEKEKKKKKEQKKKKERKK